MNRCLDDDYCWSLLSKLPQRSVLDPLINISMSDDNDYDDNDDGIENLFVSFINDVILGEELTDYNHKNTCIYIYTFRYMHICFICVCIYYPYIHYLSVYICVYVYV